MSNRETVTAGMAALLSSAINSEFGQGSASRATDIDLDDIDPGKTPFCAFHYLPTTVRISQEDQTVDEEFLTIQTITVAKGISGDVDTYLTQILTLYRETLFATPVEPKFKRRGNGWRRGHRRCACYDNADWRHPINPWAGRWSYTCELRGPLFLRSFQPITGAPHDGICL